MIPLLEARLNAALAGELGAVELLGELRFPYVVNYESVSARLTQTARDTRHTPASARVPNFPLLRPPLPLLSPFSLYRRARLPRWPPGPSTRATRS